MPLNWSYFAAMARSVDAENEIGAALCDHVLTGPSAWWPQRLRRTRGTDTAGMARQLLRRMPALLERLPADALQVTSMAIAIAEGLDPEEYPHGIGLRVHAQALRAHAYVLSFMGRYAEALDYVGRSERAFEQVPMPYFDLARLALVKASALRMQNRSEEAAALARDAGETFLLFNDRPRYVTARIIEAAVVYDGGAVERALEIWQSLEDDPGLDAVGQLRLTHNIAVCLYDLGRQHDAVEPLQRCVSEFERLGMLTERTRSRWYLGNALLATGHGRDAILALRMAWHEFASELHLMVDGALSALDLAEALLAIGEPEQVPMICHDVIAQLTTAGMPTRAITALSLLREAAAMGQASRDLVRGTHATLRRVSREEARVFAPGPGEGA